MDCFALVIFDLDGTLVDSRRDLANSVNALLAEHGAAPLDEAAVGAMVGDGAKHLVERALLAAGLATDPGPALVRFLELYDARLIETTRPYDGVVEMLATLEARGLQRAVLTNKPQPAAYHVLDALGLTRWFDAGIVGAEAAHPNKPDPAGLIAIAREAGVPLDATLMVGDARQDIEAARNAGAAVCVARYGFGFATAEPVLDGSEIVIDRPDELPARL